MSYKRNYSKDNHGYITNRGVSKYWGVANYNKGVGLAIQLYRNSSNIPKWIIPEWDASEEELASVASSYYENPIEPNGLERTVKAKGKKGYYVVSSDGRLFKANTIKSFNGYRHYAV